MIESQTRNRFTGIFQPVTLSLESNMRKLNMKKWMLPGLLCLSLILAACAPTAEPTPSEAEMAQQVAATQQAKATQNSVETLVALVTELSNQPTWTPQPTCPVCPTQIVATPTVAAVTTGTAEAVTAAATTASSGAKCFQFDFIADVNYPAGTIMKPGTTFDKTWRIKNSGTCKWEKDYDLVWVGGDSNFNKRGDIPRDVLPGDIIEVTISGFKAPLTEGTYYSYWMLAAPDGARVGYGPNQQWGLGIQIVVSSD